MTLKQLEGFPTVLTEIDPHSRGSHESLLRSYQVLQKAREWLELGAPPSVVLEMIRHVYDEEIGSPPARIGASSIEDMRGIGVMKR